MVYNLVYMCCLITCVWYCMCCRAGVSNIFMARATPVIVVLLEGCTWKNNSKQYTLLPELL
jgi:hypothetical protein